jgi:hypothetical protein
MPQESQGNPNAAKDMLKILMLAVAAIAIAAIGMKAIEMLL